MKIFQLSFALLLSLVVLSEGNAQRTVYGTYNASTGNATITANQAALADEFKSYLNDTGAEISGFELLPMGEAGKFLLASKVTGSKDGVSIYGLEVIAENDKLVASLGGPSNPNGGPTTQGCKGDPCNGTCDFKRDFGGRITGCICRGGGKCEHYREVRN